MVLMDQAEYGISHRRMGSQSAKTGADVVAVLGEAVAKVVLARPLL